jgi:stage II sporulation protein D
LIKLIFPILFFFSLDTFGDNRIRVRLDKLPKSIILEGVGIQLKPDPNPVRPISIPQLERITIQSKTSNSWVVLKGEQRWEILAPYLKVTGQNLSTKGKALPPTFTLFSRGGRIDVIAEFEMERYLLGVLPSEMPAHWSIEALKAQAVASRSYAYSKMKEQTRSHFDVEANVNDQVFKWMNESIKHKESVKEALLTTRGVVLQNNKGSFLRSFYHSHCGGQTEFANAVWEGARGGIVSKDRSCSIERPWVYTLTTQSLAKKLGIQSGIENIKVIARSGSGRVNAIEFTLSDQKKAVISAQKVRQTLGFMKLRSALFDVKRKNEEVQFVGRGFGHGVGMCQLGAKVYAEKGWGFEKILKHYYPGSRLENVLQIKKSTAINAQLQIQESFPHHAQN